MSTLRQLIGYTRHSLSGYDASKDSVAALVSPMDTSGLTVATDGVDDATGVAEVDLELLRVKATDLSSGTLQLFAFGRGYRETIKTAHATGSEITFNPSWPASTIARVINEVLDVIFPRIYAVAEVTAAVDNYGRIVVPAEASGVLSVFSQNPVDSQWSRPSRWQWDPHASDGDGRTLQVSGWLSGSSYRVVYAVKPGRFDLAGSLSQDFATVTGLDPRIETVIQLGVAARMAPFLDVSRLPALAAEARLDRDNHQDAATISRLLDSLFQRAVNAEAALLNQEHPIKAHRTVI